MTPELSVVIPNYRRPELLRRCLRSVLDAAEQSAASVEVIAVDDGSGDESCEVVRTQFPSVKLVALDSNGGYPVAINAGVAASTGDWVLTLNNDTTVDPGVFDRLLEAVRDAPEVGLAAAQQRFSDRPDVIYSAGTIVDGRAHASDRLMGAPADASETEPIAVFGACGAAALYRRSLLHELGGLDERFAFGLEDVDLAWRAQMRGWRCLYVPRALVYHDLGGTVAHGSDLRLFQAGRNRLLLIAKNLDTGQLVRMLPRIVAFDLAYVLYGLVRLRSMQPVKGRVAGLRLWRAARAAGAAGRRPVELSPAAPLSAALRRRRLWRSTGTSVDRPGWVDHV